MSASEESGIKFSVMASLFNWMQKSKSSVKKRSKFRKFLDAYCRKPGDYFSAIRLILPALDRERGSYGLKEHALAVSLIDALGMSRDSPDAQRLLNWRKGGPKSGYSAGNFSLIAYEVLQRRQGMTSGELTLKELNELLDRLASSENRGEKTSVLSDLIRKTNAQEMRWIIMIIIKDLKLGISEKSIFHEFHPDAEDLFNVTCDLKLVCEKLRDRTQRHKRQDIEVGKPVRPQLALRVSNVAAAWKKLHGKEIVVECKFDGDRIQIHKSYSEVHFFSRNFLDHQEYGPAMSDIIANNVLVDRCILDGEMLVWDSTANCFAEFGSNQEIAKAAKEGLNSDCQLCYVAFDILYVGDTSIIHQTLNERHDLLRKVVSPVKGRLEILVPEYGPSANRSSGGPCWSVIPQSVDSVEKFFKETIENRDEGIVLKDLGSKWEPSDRSGKWLKLKPEYVRAGTDLDVLIIGGYYGSGRHGGQVAQFLVGLAERTSPNTHPKRFISFCRVGTGLSDEELDAVVTKLKPYFRKNEYPKKAPPSFYQVTNNAKERPDVWIESPEKSIIVSITSDIRTITSEVFSAPYCLRFPRIDRVRFDKPWYECLDVQTFVELVHSSNGTTQRREDDEHVLDHKPKRLESRKKGESKLPSVPRQFITTDVSDVKGESLIFIKMVFYFANVPSSHSLDLMHKMVVKNGGTFSMNLNNSVTHCIAAESRGIKFQAAMNHGDVIHYSWLVDCCSQKKLLPLQPKYFLHLSEASKRKLQEEMDEFSDSYYLNVGIPDLHQLLSNTDRPEDPDLVAYYNKRYCPDDKRARFHDCCIYFLLLLQSPLKSEYRSLLGLAERRMKLEVSFHGGSITQNLSHATHVVVVSAHGLGVDLSMLQTSLPETQKHLLCRERLFVVASEWLENCIEKDQKLPENSYCLNLNCLEESCIESSRLVKSKDQKMSPSNEDRSGKPTRQPRLVTLPKNEGKRKRGSPAKVSSTRRKTVSNLPPRRPARRGSKASKISEDNSDESMSPERLTSRTEAEAEGKTTDAENFDSVKPGYDILDQLLAESSKSSPSRNTVDQDIEQCVKPGYDIPDQLIAESSKSSSSRNTVDQDIEQSVHGDTAVEEHANYLSSSSYDGLNEKREFMTDPVKAMLESMIPSLGDGKLKSAGSVHGNENIPVQGKPTNSVPVLEHEQSHLDSNPNPAKKKKVSYKDVAKELLMDR